MPRSRRALPPLSPGYRRGLRIALTTQYVVGAIWLVQAVSGHSWLAWIAGVGFVGAASLMTYDLRRRSDPARTAGWGRQRRDGESDARRRLRRWQGDAKPAGPSDADRNADT